MYRYLEKLAGLGLIDTDMPGLRPYSKAEAARMVIEAEERLKSLDGPSPAFAAELLARCRELIPREISLYREAEKAPLLDFNPLASARLRYVYLDGIPRSYVRDVVDPGNQSAFGFIGGNLRPIGPGIVHTNATEGTPLLEYTEGAIFPKGNNVELRWAAEGYVKEVAVLYLEPSALINPDHDKFYLQKGYVKVGGGGLELEAGRDANWFGPGYRGNITLTNNARNFDLLKVSSPEPVDVGWLKKYVGEVKYAIMFSRFEESGAGLTLRHPYFAGVKLDVKPKPWMEIGINFVRQFGGPGFVGGSSFRESIFGGGDNDHANSIAGIDLRFRIPWLRNTEVYGEYAGEDSAGFWPFVESYVGGVYIPRLTDDGKNDFRFEYFWGNSILYADWQFPEGYVQRNMIPGHSQGGATQEFFFRYSHWFSVRNNLALEYIRTDRGRVGRLPGQELEVKDAGRAFWTLPVYGDVDLGMMYGWEKIDNFNLQLGVSKTNQIFKVDLSYRY